MKKSALCYTLVFFALMLIVGSFFIMRAVKEMNGDAHTVNYSGLVRGATQRLVKQELMKSPNNALVVRISGYLDGLDSRKNVPGNIYMNDKTFQDFVAQLQTIWHDLQDSIEGFRKGTVSPEALLALSEKHFQIADEAVHAAEEYSAQKLFALNIILNLGIALTTLMVVIVFSLALITRSTDKKQYAVLFESNRQLEKAITLADQASKAKSNFLSNMSHDIRTPLNGIMGMTTIAEGSIHDPQKLRSCLKKIHTSSRHLLHLINDVLDMSRIESGSVTLHNVVFTLPRFVEELLGIVQTHVAAKQQHLEIAVQNITHEQLLGDPLRLSQVLINILSNAVKFTPAGGTISLVITELPPRKLGYAHFQFVCSDTGIGMEKEYLSKIFESFSRERDSRIDAIEGSGLGMSIVKSIVDLMDGTITVTSQKGHGTTFTVQVDIAIDEQPQGTNTATPPDPTTYAGLRVLLVDDDSLTLESASAVLVSLGMHVDAVNNPVAALEQVAKARAGCQPYQLMIVDWKMPEMTGLELTLKIRAMGDTETPIFVSSAYNWVDIEEKAHDAAITGIISKPLFKSGIQQTLSRLASAQHSGNKPVAANANQCMPLQGIRILLVDDNELNLEIANELLIAAGAEADLATDGQKALEMFAASPEGFYDTILMDVQMPIMNGYQATKAIRALTQRNDAQHIPIIALTANAFDTDIQETLACGMNLHIAKPIDVTVLYTTITKLLQQKPTATPTLSPQAKE
ncbi:hybrid sensor histidine kinase/response regulator [Desulfovibrio cuneatus]|uniref:hybrid sensor histidine kinase/response regulator n=1 Tax=Desulfovibrio cuneatus TaxID=159728 RepID=UPI00040E72C8|nr:response regulator [Desulfovibrio cuneatus]